MTSVSSMYVTILGVLNLARNSDLAPVPGGSTEQYAQQPTQHWKCRHGGCQPMGPMPAARTKRQHELHPYNSTI